MKLYTAPLSLFARKVEIALREKGRPFDAVMVPFSQTQGYSPKHPDVLAANPKGQVPVLVDGDVAIYDSTVILEYLEDAYPKPALYPRDPAERARCRLLDLYADEIMLPPVRALMHRNTPGERDPERWQANEARAKEAEAELERHYAELAAQLGNRQHFCGAFGAADIAVFMMVFWSLRLGGPGLERQPALAAWYRRLLRRPAFTDVVTAILEADRALSAPVAGAYGGGRWLPGG
ncbi:MAG TPA: glutathione S-transferase family protein [Woeseiaceae bacterium]|nr:glutathione S-transferase family protein [Woeseiaceae bacterium]